MLKIYSDAGCTQEVKFNQAFPGTGAQTAFTLTNFTGGQLASVYRETKVTQAGVTFVAGVGSGFSGLTPSALIGQRVVHNGAFRGTVVVNDATTITLSDLTYAEATASAAVVSSYTKLLLGTDYTVAGDIISTIGTPLTAAMNLIAVPASAIGVNFGGVTGASKTTAGAFWVKRTPGYTYDTLMVKAVDLSQTAASLTQASVVFTDGVGTGFSGLVAGALKGRALLHAGVFRGMVTANTTTTVTISDLTYDGASADATALTIGSTELALDSSGSPGTFARIVHPAAITDDTAIKIHFRDTVVVPTAAMNYPNNIVSVTGIEYLV